MIQPQHEPAQYCLVMPFFNEAAFLADVLASLAAQRFDGARWRLVAVDNGSTDGGAQVVMAWFAGTQRGRLVEAHVRSIPAALNRGLAFVEPGEFVIRLDAHTIYGPDYVATIDRSFAALPARVWCVGTGPHPLASDDYGKALQVALYTNRFGLGPADFRGDGEAMVRVSTVYLGAFRPGVLQRLGGFDERWLANEDCELTERIWAAGGEVFRVPLHAGLIVTRGPLTTIVKFARYGYWRAQTLKRYPRALRLRHVLPPLALLASLLLAFTPLRRALLAFGVLYALGTLRYRQRDERPLVTAGTLLFFPLVHAAFACGLLYGAVRTPARLR